MNFIKRPLIGTLMTVCLTFPLWGQQQATLWKGKHWEGVISPKGHLEQLVFTHGSGQRDTIPFFTNKPTAGPSFYAKKDGKETVASWVPDGVRAFRASIDGVECRMAYKVFKGYPALVVTLVNKGHTPFQPTKAGLKLGIDTYMAKFPEWFGKYFPTLMRNERSHFFGYLQAPSGRALAIVSPQPVASWSVEYNLGYQDPPPHWFMGHRIESLNLDLMNALPLPSHHPQDLWQLAPQERKEWIIALVDLPQLNHLEAVVNEVAEVPVIRLSQTSFRPGEKAVFEVLAENPQVTLTSDRGELIGISTTRMDKGVYRVSGVLPRIGLYTVRVTDRDKVAEGVLSAHASWQWTLEQARKATLTYHQKATSHAESWYGFYSAFLAARYFPNKELDEAVSKRFDYLFDLLHDAQTGEPRYYQSRIQNTSTTIGMLIDRYEASGEVEFLKKASLLADWLMKGYQRPDGAYVNHNVVYTSVIYVAKSMLELTLAEQALGRKDAAWKEAAERHYRSAKAAVDQLVASQGNFETEGELTFEDGMISCSALQIGLLALMQQDEASRAHYTSAMLKILNSHDCLTQLRVPDARRRGGTMRYWEAQYDVQMLPNMFNSPHGWSGWRAYATYYAYLLTGNERWLKETGNAMGAFSNLIDYRNGELRWAFVVDPYLEVKQTCSADTQVTADSLSFGNPHPELYEMRRFVIGEQYVRMVSNWQTVNTQDNDVHELFKCMGEAVLTNAFVVVDETGTARGYNCSVSQQGDRLVVKPTEKQITHVHCNLKRACTVTFDGRKRSLPKGYLGWAFGGDVYAGTSTQASK